MPKIVPISTHNNNDSNEEGKICWHTHATKAKRSEKCATKGEGVWGIEIMQKDEFEGRL